MKATVVGYRPYDMTENDRRNFGVSLYVTQVDPTDKDIRGSITAKYTVKGGTSAYDKLMNYQFVKPFDADLDVYVSPAGKVKLLDMKFGIEK